MNNYRDKLKSSPQPQIGPKTPRKPVWESLSEIKLDSAADKVKFLFVFILVSIALITLGDVFRLIHLNGSGIALNIVGYIVMATGFLAPLFRYLNDHAT